MPGIPPPSIALPPEEIFDLIIRFTAAIPDLPLRVESPRTTTFVALKVRIREHLDQDVAGKRLRLIQAGKVLNDTTPISSLIPWRDQSLSATPTPPPPPPPKSSKAKGKEAVRDTPIQVAEKPARQVYVQCSIGDALTPTELEDESILATSTHQKLLHSLEPLVTAPTHAQTGSTTSSAPLGFDRLLTSGFSTADIATLRASFLTHLSHTHTPDTLPTGLALRALEDRWLDSTAQDTQTADGTGFDDDESSQLDDMLWGNIFGFFWPLGALVWGFREEGVWTRRRQIAVFTGLGVNLVFGFARLSSSR